MARRKAPGEIRILRWLLMASAITGLLTTLSYAAGASIAVRFFAPRFGAWWSEHEFQAMLGSAYTFGMLLAIRVSAGLIDDPQIRRRAIYGAMLAGLILQPFIAHRVGDVARLGWNATGGGVRERMIRLRGYSDGIVLDKVLIAGIYFLKSVFYSLLAGLALFAISGACFMFTSSSDSGAEAEVSR